MEIKSILLGNLQTERRITRETIAALRDGEVLYKPTEQQMCFGDQALHIVTSWHTLRDGLQGKEWVWERGYTVAKYPTLEAILAEFDAMHAADLAYYESLENEQFDRLIQTPWGAQEHMVQLIYSFLTHETHHRGQLVTYLRLKGMQPPAY
ncbi:MAG TPA: DinB family protein [Symbiobacteriaceae bacterium]|nr:DinB family protein [Symbiobacteriaceae bacterium]